MKSTLPVVAELEMTAGTAASLNSLTAVVRRCNSERTAARAISFPPRARLQRQQRRHSGISLPAPAHARPGPGS